MTRWERSLNFLCSAKKGEKIEMLSKVIEWIYKVTLVGCVPFHSTGALCLGLKPGGSLLHE